jgi:hypothetical protein
MARVKKEKGQRLKPGPDKDQRDSQCDVIVCWVHNWPECPEWIEVVELRKVVDRMADRRDRT